MSRIHSSRAKCFCAAILFLASTSASAVELARVEGFGPVSRGFAGGGVAYPVGAGGALLNPAELLRLETDQELMFQITEIHAKIEVIDSATGEHISGASPGNNRGPYELPELAYAIRRGDWAFGSGVFAAGGFGIEYGNDSFLSRTTTNNVATGLPISTRVGQLRIPFAVAWRPAPRWRIGASVDVVNASLNLQSLLDAQQVGLLIQSGRVSGSLVPVLGSIPNLSGVHLNFVRNNFVSSELSAWGVAGRLGASYQVDNDTSLALTYELRTALGNLEGHGQLTAVDSSNNHITLSGKGTLPEFEFPAAFVFGAAHRFSPSFSAVADLRETFWSSVLRNTILDFRSTDGGTLHAALPTGFRDLTTLALGIEWHFQPTLTLRAGGSHAFQQLVGDHSLNGSFPTLTREQLAANLAYRPFKMHEFDAGLSYDFTEHVHNPGGNINSIPAIEGRNRQINPVISYRCLF